MNINHQTNAIYLRNKQKILLPIGKNVSFGKMMNFMEVATILKNVEHYGFTFSDDLLKKILDLSLFDVENVYSNIIGALKEAVGANVKHKPMYPNFPRQVMEAGDAELYLNAMIHYFGNTFGARIMPGYRLKKRDLLLESTDLKIIEVGTEEDFISIFTSLINSKTAISEQNKEDVEWFVKSLGKNIKPLLPTEIPNKENKAYLVSKIDEHIEDSQELYSHYFKNVTDVLRMACALSGGDVSLATPTKFKTFSRRERRLIKNLGENCKNIKEDMSRYGERWKRLNDKIHIFENIKYPNLAEAMISIYNKEKIKTFNSELEKALKEKDIETAVDLLSQRPGEFARRLNQLILIGEDPFREQPHDIEKYFKRVASKVSTPVLLGLISYFENRNEEKDLRVFFPKGNVAKVVAINNKLDKINRFTNSELIKICKEAIIEQYGKKESLGKVYIGEEMKDFNVPFGLRSSSKALRTVGRGSKVDIDDKNILRLFIYWKQALGSRTDIDLSAVSLDKNFKTVSYITYWSLRNIGGVSSGDITSAPNGASEFIDLDIEKQISSGVRYIVMSVNSYSGQDFSDIPVCFAGFMTKKNQRSGEIYEPKTVQNKFDLTAKSKIAIPIIFDLMERKMIWTDLSLKKNPSRQNNVAQNMSSLSLLAKSMVELKKPNLYDLFYLHAIARGEIVSDKSMADTIFSVDEGITPFDFEEILANYL